MEEIRVREIKNDELSGMARQQIEYKVAVLWQVNRINQLASTPPTQFASKESMAFTFYMAVMALEAMLFPYLDEEYKKNVPQDFNSKNPDEQYAYAIKKYAELNSLLHRLGLLLEITVAEIV